MSFSENVQFLRKRENMTQEQFAERLEVSRQAVSKWESGQSYPEMDKLLQMCQMFSCDMDTLVQGDVTVGIKEDTAKYNQFMDWFTLMVTGGVVLILLGVTALTGLDSLVHEDLLAIGLLVLVAVAVCLFIIAGIKGEYFVKRYPEIVDFYTEEQHLAFQQKFAIAIASGVVLLILGVCLLIGGEYRRMDGDRFMTVFMLIVTVSVGIFVYFGAQYQKYDIEGYNKKHGPKDKPARLANKIVAVIMMIAVAVFLVVGLVFDAWHPGWVVFVVAGILCGIVEVAMGDGNAM